MNFDVQWLKGVNRIDSFSNILGHPIDMTSVDVLLSGVQIVYLQPFFSTLIEYYEHFLMVYNNSTELTQKMLEYFAGGGAVFFHLPWFQSTTSKTCIQLQNDTLSENSDKISYDLKENQKDQIDNHVDEANEDNSSREKISQEESTQEVLTQGTLTQEKSDNLNCTQEDITHKQNSCVESTLDGDIQNILPKNENIQETPNKHFMFCVELDDSVVAVPRAECDDGRLLISSMRKLHVDNHESTLFTTPTQQVVWNEEVKIDLVGLQVNFNSTS
jgi:hypothetical protein